MSLSSNKTRIIQSVLCEIDYIKQGDLSCADNMLKERVEVMDRIWAMESLHAEDNSDYDSLIFFLNQQINELTLALTITI